MARRLEGTLWGGSGAGSGDPYAEDDYRQQLNDPNSYASRALALPQRLVEMQTAVNLGDVSKGKAIYDEVTGFFAEHPEDVARGMAVDASRSTLLRSIQNASFMARDRRFDAALVIVDGQRTDAGTLFGPGGTYQKHMDVEVRQSAGFSKEVSDAMAVGDDRSRLLGRIVEPYVQDFRKTGLPKTGFGQYKALAQRVYRGNEANDLGFDTMDVVVDDILKHHMQDGTALARYDLLVNRLRAVRDASPDGFNGIEEAQKLCNSVSAFERDVAGGPDGRLTGDASRGMVAFLRPVLERNPGADLDSPALRAAVGDVAEMAARLKRSGVDLLTLMSDKGLPVSQDVAAYVIGRSQGAHPYEGNFFTKLGYAHDLVSRFVTSDWDPVRPRSRGNPAEAVGQATGVFQRSSGLDGLDSAGVAFYRTFMPEVIRRLGTMDAVSAVADAFSDDDVRKRMASALSQSMGVPLESAEHVYRELVAKSMTTQGLVNSFSLDRAVGEVAFGYTTDPARIAAKPALKAWYGRNVGETGAYFDSLLGSDWNPLLNDDVIGPFAGVKASGAQRQAMVDRYKQTVKAKMAAAVQEGQSPRDVARSERNMGTFIAVTGYIDAGGTPHDITELDGLDEKARRAKLRGTRPILVEAAGSLDSARQDISGWMLPDGMYLPTIAPGSWSGGAASRAAMRRAMAQLRRMYENQLKASDAAMMSQARKGPTGF